MDSHTEGRVSDAVRSRRALPHFVVFRNWAAGAETKRGWCLVLSPGGKVVCVVVRLGLSRESFLQFTSLRLCFSWNPILCYTREREGRG